MAPGTDLGWSQQHGEWLKNSIASRFRTPTEAADFCDVNRSTIHRWFQGTTPRTGEERERLAKFLGFDSFEKLMEAADLELRTTWARPLSFPKIHRVLNDVDCEVLALFNRDNLHAELAGPRLNSFIETAFHDRNRDCFELLNRLRDDGCRKELLESLPSPSVEVTVDEKFKKVTFESNRSRIVVSSPELLWDCHCDSIKKSETTCPIHANKDASEIESGFFGQPVSFRYNDCVFRWQDSDSLWPPSVDSFHMACDLRKRGVLENSSGSVLDIGAGTGFLGILIASRSRHVNHLELADVSLLPQLYSAVNWQLNCPARNVKFDLHLGINNEWFQETKRERKFDTIVVNPPYLPYVDEFPKLSRQSTVSGTSLLQWVIEQGSKIGKDVYVQYSNLAQEAVEESKKRSGVKLIEIGPEREVPFRVRHAYADPVYISTLEQMGLLERKDNQRYLHSHKVRTYLVWNR